MVNKETGEYEPTEDAYRLLRARLFNGANDAVTSKNVLYKEMSQGDYVATSFINFFNVESEFSRNIRSNIDMANYFMRIPSDAPKNFIITAPKYSANGLFIIENQKEADNKINESINRLTSNEFDKYSKEYNQLEQITLQQNADVNKKSNIVTLNKMRHHITAQHPGNIIINKRNQLNESRNEIKEGAKVSITFKYESSNGVPEYYVMSGTFEKHNGQEMIANPQFETFLDIAHSSEVRDMLSKHYTKVFIDNGTIKRTINTNHVLFKQIKNMFIQELTDAATAINLLFEHNEGVVNVDPKTGMPIFTKDYNNSEESGKKLFAVYHVDKSGKVLKKKSDGTYETTGKVFTSDRFVIAKKVKGEVVEINYGKQIIKEAFDFLYGGAHTTNSKSLRFSVNTNGVKIELNDNQERIINEKLTNFILDYIDDTKERLNQYKEFIPAKYQTDENVTEFALNHHIMFGNFNDLFEGDTKFYKDSQTFLKRAKEAQASGTPYGNTNYAVDMLAEPAKINSRLDSTTFNHIDSNGNPIGTVQFQLRDKFVGVTVKNSIRPNLDLEVEGVNGAKKDGALVKALAENIAESFKKDGMKARAAKALAIEKARDIVAGVERDGRHGYYGTKVNDAQSYITFEEWVRRITARGQFMKYKPLIEAILDESKPVDVKTIEQFVQVQKNFYYDQYYNSKLHTTAPRQIKNAEFVIVKRFVKGTQLEQVYDLMTKHSIDQLNTEETSKAGKANVLTIWNDNGEITEDNLKDFEARVTESTEYFTYNNLYTQQETPQHLDAQNKAGIQIMKKILDNIDENSSLWEIKQEFFNNYVANIKESYLDLMEKLGIIVDENGNIHIDETTNEIEGFNKQIVFDLLKQEMIRQGLDSNSLDYVTLNDDENSTHNGVTVVPTYFGNKANKLENIAQSLFNNNITRQKLPGFHAAQITSIGFTPLSQNVKNRKYSKDLYYHPKEYQLKDGSEIISEREYNKKTPEERKKYEYIGVANYIEIMLPASNFGLQRTDKNGRVKSNEELLEELHKAGLDMMIGYRIPTEGKQSICIMKVVDFIDDSLGSTIVVPDDWVSQTGSDFDIDSVYGINFKSRINKRTGKIEKIEYHNEATISDYIKYLVHKSDNILLPDKKTAFKELKELIKNQINEEREERNEEFEELHEEEDEIWGELPNGIKKEIIKVNKKGRKTKNKAEYIEQNNKVLEVIDTYLSENDVKKKERKQINKYRNIISEINDFLNESVETWQERFDRGLEVINNKSFKMIEEQAENLGLLSFEEFKQLQSTEFNSRDARNNKILECMIEILRSEESMEENFSRSNFEDIISARDKSIDENVKTRRELRSPYNFLDQAEYQEDVMSGAKLKAFSVTRDTFCSICNTVKPNLSRGNEVSIIYLERDGYNYEQLVNSFGFDKNDVQEIGKDKDGKAVYKVVHRTFGWSKNNRNVVGKLITAYSSQTTAHILDAVKEGAIPNVNDYTFQVYKMFPDLGSDYQTGIPFIIQDGVKAIVDAYNANKSIYSRGSGNPINTAFKTVAKKFLKLQGIDIKEHDSLDKYYNALKPFANDLAKLFGAAKTNFKIKLDNDNASLLLMSGSRYKERLKNEGVFASSPVEESTKLLFDLGVILQFNRLNNIATSIGNYTRVCNPDKFGAKQSIFATNKIFSDIVEILENDQKNILLTKDEKGNSISLLESIYPGLKEYDSDVLFVEDFLNSDNTNESSYPPLNAFLRYATATSIMINRTLFETQDENFVRELNKLKDDFTNGQVLTEKIYKELQNYVLNYLYRRTQFVSKRLLYFKDRGIVTDDSINLDEERKRIYGYGKSAKLEVTDYRTTKNSKAVLSTGYYARQIVEANTEKVYLFGDNTDDRINTHYVPSSTQAQIRGLSNAIGIDTKKDRGTNESSYFTDADFDVFKKQVDEAIQQAIDRGKQIVIPKDGIGTGKAQLETRAPKLFKYLQDKLNSLLEGETINEEVGKKEFRVSDINNPTDTEIEQFSTLSPAQKVAWIQSNFENKRIFKYIDVSLFNDKQSGNVNAGAQTIKYIEGNSSIETIYQEFNKAFYNTNPLVKMAAMDLVKYAFVVEGYRMKRNAINKIISNKVLIDDNKANGTNIIAELNTLIGDIANATIPMSLIRQNFIRSHSSMSQISTYRVEKNSKGVYELPLIDDTVFLTNSEEDMALAKKYGMTFEDKYGATKYNKYIKLRIGRNIILYKVLTDGKKIVAYPLNNLEENENSNFSVNSENNKFSNSVYYTTLAQDYFNTIPEEFKVAEFIKEHKELKDKNKPPRIVLNEKGAKSFDINEKNSVYTDGFEEIINKVNQHFSTTVNEPLYMRAPVLEHFIKYDGVSNGTFQMINGKRYMIYKYNAHKENKYLANNKNVPEKELSVKPRTLQEVINNSYNHHYILNDVYVITPAVEQSNINIDAEISNDIHFSSVDEVDFATTFIEDVQTTAIAEQNKDAQDIIQYFKDKDITANSESVKINIDDVISLATSYITNNVEQILDDFKYAFGIFINEPDGTMSWKTLRIDDPRVIQSIRNNDELKERFLKLILKARAFVTKYQDINELDIDSTDESISKNLNKIKEAINKLSTSSVILKAENNFATEFIAKQSNNPLIQNTIISVLDGYHSASMMDAWINDLQETANPLLQIITKEVMGDIRAKEMKAYKEVEKVKKQIEDIKERAKKAGFSINWDNIVDKNGKIVQDYTQEFVDKIQEHREAIEEAKNKYGENSKEHIKAKLEYDIFQLKYVNREVIDTYHQERIALDEEMLNNYPTIFVEYKKLIAERNKILKHAKKGVLEGDKLEEFKRIKQEIDNLTSKYYYDVATDTFLEKRDGSDPSNPFKYDTHLLNLYNSVAAKHLRDYIEKKKALQEAYFETQDKESFSEELAHNLEIVESYEKRVKGRITTPANILAMHDDYIKAKSWLEVNTRFTLNEEFRNKINDAFNTLRETSKGRARLNKIVKDNNLYDRFGVIKADEISDENIDKIREEQLDNYGLKEGQPWQDKSLISNAPTDDTVFTLDFYKGMQLTSGITNPNWLAKVQEINAILERHYDSATRTVYTSELTEDELTKLIELYDELEDLKKYTSTVGGKRVRKYIKKNVEFVLDYDKYNEQKRLIQGKDKRIQDLWAELNERTDEDGNVVPNRLLYGYMVPKGYKSDGTGDNSKVDTKKTEALRTIYKHTQTVKTEYYYKKFREMSRKSETEFNDWYKRNHVYNPYTRVYEPLSCWTTIQYVSDDPTETIGEYKANYLQKESSPKEDAYNDNYHGRHTSTASNYKNDYYQNYDNNNAMNTYEKEIRDLVETVIDENAKTTSAQNFFKKGYMIARGKNNNKDASFYTKEAFKMLGWINTATGTERWTKDEDVDYANDKPIAMPFTAQLKNKDTKSINYKTPVQEVGESDIDYNKRLKEWKDEKKANEEENAKIHAELLDRDFESVIEDFILKSAHFNAVQDNKYMLFYAKNMIDRLDYYVKNAGFNDFQKDYRRSTDEENKYVTKKDTKLQEQYVNWIRRLVYDQWKRPNNKLTRAANIAQSLTSAKFMMLNVTGGIANVTVGSTQIYAEMLANEYFGKGHAALGLATWSSNVGSFIADMYSDKASSVASAIIKAFNVVDFDEVNGIVSVADAEEYMKRARDIAFSPQATGEHMMQNGALFSMCHSHRLVPDPEGVKNGRLSYKLQNEAEFMREADENALFAILSDSQKVLFEKFKKYELSDPNKTKEYAWFRKYLTVEFANLYLDDAQKNEFISKRRELQNKAKEKFNDDSNYPTLMSQFKLDEDGKLGFKDDSKLFELGDEAWQILGRFKGRVISVNKKIHGVYDKLGAAKLESYWWGSLVMQYHKHIYPGLMKRYRRQGYFNEERGTIEKGCYAAIKDFISIPLHRANYAKKIQDDNNMTDDELKAVVGIQNIVKNYVEFATHIRMYWNIIPENERANIKRAIGDFAGALSAISTAIALRCIADDDDGLAYNLMMYEADRLASESMMYNPFGLISEGKKLWSSPVAVQGAITDMFHTVGFISQYMIQGDEFDDVYQSGMYAGEHKMEVFIKRNIPMYHSIYMLERLQKSNKYYKLGDNMLSIIPVKDIAEFITK